ncbi:hypothetical protein LTR17_020467 [Elasticomyces elasticus]|nr:hypothetical protein LTR17_020467 [Elasticomyces elasticus]
MPRLVRRAPLLERLKAFLDPYDFLLWLSEELNDDTYQEWLKDWATPLGIALNIVFILARGASKAAQPRSRDDVFGDVDGSKGSGWFVWLTVIKSATASSRAYPDAEREVWELAVWDPKPLNLTIFTLFSPGHLLLYFALLPPATLDPRPSFTIITALAFGTLLSLQLGFLKTSFSQQSKDSALVHGEVMNEYDTKFVRPSLNRPVRDVGIQTRESATSPRGVRTREVDVYTPTTIVNRGFRTNPNTNYASQYDPDGLSTPEEGPARHNAAAPPLTTPTPSTYVNGYTQSNYSRPSTSGGADFSSPLKPHHERLRERSPVKGDGGSMGVYSHAASPLRKAVSSSHLKPSANGVGRTASPLKRISTPGGGLAFDGGSARRRETGRF